ncbi:cache domain-containing sensor histidine kinase [Paenibacillus aceris]|uniref:Two-component system sensor histidine kinase YesM n=1 Tax=Paenibacillus aceris TaxID=869555 RepID=A0ABS4I695_9BACL|nr:sensor histidine kinase [Paenibacillus aceris]MBP1966437.1 two-component system sensor histidine kinase YesM [Paenibacillus aceris]NHW39581.1 sensor histidine kinase [Paenibacillus aceris]
MYNPFKRHRIDHLLFGSFACLIVILIIAVIVISYNYSARELVSNTSYYQQNLLNQLNKQIVTQMNSIEQISLAASRNTNVQSFLGAEGDSYSNYQQQKTVVEYMANIVFSTNIIESIDLYVLHQPMRISGTPVNFKSIEALKEESWYPLIQDTDFTWIPESRMTTEDGSTPVISFIRKIYSYTGRYQGDLAFHMKSSAIRNLLKDEISDSTHRSSTRVMMDFKGRIISTLGDYSIGPDMQELILNRIDNSRTGNAHIRFGSSKDKEINDSLIVWTRLYNSNWILVEITPWKEITRGSTKISTILLFVGLIAIGFAIILTLVLSNQFTRPIRILLREMNRFNKKLPQSSQKTQLPSDYHNEFGTIFIVYKNMLDSNAEMFQSLENRYIQQKESEIKALQAMINPHFLYNTLDQINWMAIELGHFEISKVVGLMGRMFRIGLSNGEYLIEVQEELEHIHCYMELQRIRLGNKFDYVVEVPEAILNGYILKLTLQPFVENAVMHGLHGVQQGRIVIRAVESAEGILFTITDNGKGMKEAWENQKRRKTGGYGIRNVKERMDAYYSGTYGIHIKSEPGQGTEVCIRQPRIENSNHWREQYVESGNRR